MIGFARHADRRFGHPDRSIREAEMPQSERKVRVGRDAAILEI